MKRTLIYTAAALLMSLVLFARHAEAKPFYVTQETSEYMPKMAVVDGKEHRISGYKSAWLNISLSSGGRREYYYVRLRDIAALLAGKDGGFDVSWNAKSKRVALNFKKAYTPSDRDLIERPQPRHMDFEQLYLSVDGVDLEQPWTVLLADGEYYVDIDTLRTRLGNPFVVDNGEKLILYPGKTDIATVDAAGFEALLKNGEYKILFMWAPWCPHCKECAPQVKQLIEGLGGAKDKLISIVYDYAGYRESMLYPLFGIEKSPVHKVLGMNADVIAWAEKNFSDENGEIWFPTVRIIGPKGEMLDVLTNQGNWLEALQKAEKAAK